MASHGSYSDATANDRTTLGELTEQTPKLVIESGATIATPLIPSVLLECRRNPNRMNVLAEELAP